jgi:hypothetical protein
MGLRCETCGHYQNPRKIRNYPNCDNEKLGWRTCAVGSTIRRYSMACAKHTALEPKPQKRQLIHTPGRRIVK